MAERQGGAATVAAAVAAGFYMLYAATVGRAIHRAEKEAGSSPLYQHATAAPGSCISHAWPFLVQEGAQSDGLSSRQSSIGSETKSKEATS